MHFSRNTLITLASNRQLSTTRARRPRTRYCSYVSCVAPSTETVSSLSPLATRRSARARSNGTARFVLTVVAMPRALAISSMS